MGIAYRSGAKVYPRRCPGHPGLARCQRTRRARDPIPTFDETTDEMDGSIVWSRLDMFKSFHQISLHPNSRKYATFSTPRGLCRCTTLVMGLTNASKIPQRVMSIVLSGIPGVRWIHDDITIYARTVREHKNILPPVSTDCRNTTSPSIRKSAFSG